MRNICVPAAVYAWHQLACDSFISNRWSFVPACVLLSVPRFQPQEKFSKPRSYRSRFGDGRAAYEKEQEEARAKEAYFTSLEVSRTYPPQTIEALRRYDEKEINLDLVKALLRYICTMGEGAILVFLPGWDTISKLNDMLKSDPVFRSQQKYLIIPLHSMMPTAFQQQVGSSGTVDFLL